MTGKSKVDSWLKQPVRRARSAFEVKFVFFFVEFRSKIEYKFRLFTNHCMLLDIVELIHGENTRYVRLLMFNEYEIIEKQRLYID